MKKVVRHLLIASILFFFSGNSIAQSACTWQQGDLITYNQVEWGTTSSDAGTHILNEFGILYFPPPTNGVL